MRTRSSMLSTVSFAGARASGPLKAKFIWVVVVLIALATSEALAGNTIPNTPAGHTLQAWLDAFNSGDRMRIESYVRRMDPSQTADGMLVFRKDTGGFDLLSIDRSEPLHILFRVKEKDSTTIALGDLLVRDGKPPTVKSFGLRALPPGASPVVVTLDSALRARVIDGIADDLKQFYVDTGVASRMIDALLDKEAAGGYADLSDGYLFAARLTSDLRDISHDRHLAVSFSPFKMPSRGMPTAQDTERMRQQLERSNCAFDKLEILPDDIGYVKFDAFMPPAICAPTVEAAMGFIAHADAIIFDLRDNGGGDPFMVALIASYLFGQPTHLNDIYDRSGNSTTQYWTLPYLTGARLPTQPVYILTSKRTFSGAEEFCYDLQTRKRAVIVGETTGGGAHLVAPHVVADYFVVGVPFARAVNPITHTDWEGRGIQPDVSVPAANALETAVQLATRQLQAAVNGSQVRSGR